MIALAGFESDIVDGLHLSASINERANIGVELAFAAEIPILVIPLTCF